MRIALNRLGRLVCSLAPVVLCIPACQGTENEQRGTSVRDSAGVSIFEAVADTAPVHLREPDLVLAGHGSVPFYDIVGVSQLSSGVVVVAERTQILMFAPSGDFLRVVGRDGAGPGEFSQIIWLQLHDSIYVNDYGNGRVAVIDSGGNFRRLEAFPESSPGVNAHPTSVLSDGTLLGETQVPKAMESGINISYAHHAIYTPSGAVDLGMRFSSEDYGVPVSRGFISVGMPFARVGEVASTADSWFYTDGVSYMIHEHDRSGALSRIFARKGSPPPVSSVDLEGIIAPLRESAPRGGGQSPIERWYREMPLPATYPAYIRLVADRGTGSVWALASAPAGAPRCWDVFSPVDAAFRTVCLPANFTLYAVLRGRVLGVLKGPDGEESVARYSVLPL